MSDGSSRPRFSVGTEERSQGGVIIPEHLGRPKNILDGVVPVNALIFGRPPRELVGTARARRTLDIITLFIKGLNILTALRLVDT